jgi:hypothetical protein
MAHHSLFDTCVWLDLASDPFADEILSRLEDLIATTQFQLVVPQVIKEEFDRHKVDCAEKLAKKMAVRVAETTRYARQFADEETRADLIARLEVFAKRIEAVPNAAAHIVGRIEGLFELPGTTKLETTDGLLHRAALRGYEKKAPFTSNKNSVADAILLEAYLAFFGRHQKGECTFSFVTVNKSDFADPKDHRKPHPDLGEPFADGSIVYSINLAEEINRLTTELPPAPKREKRLLAEDVVQRASGWVDPFDDDRPIGMPKCPACGARALFDYGWRGFTWHKRCAACQRFFDTGIHMDDD